MRCEEVMKRDVVSVSPEDTVEVAARHMREENVGFIPVCDADRKVVGLAQAENRGRAGQVLREVAEREAPPTH